MGQVLEQPIQFRAGDLSDNLVARTREGENPSRAADRDLHRYYALVQRGMRRLPPLSEREASLIVDVCKSWSAGEDDARLLWVEVEDGIALESLDERWGVDGAVLVQKLRALDPLGCVALVDACERFWVASTEDPSAEMVTLLRQVGLVRSSAPQEPATTD